MAEVHFSALSDRWVSADNNDAFCAEKIGKYYVFGVAEGMSDLPGESSASGIAISSLREFMQSPTGAPSEILAAAVHRIETRISAATGESGIARGSTHLSACLLDDALDCTILDTGEGNAYLIDPKAIRTPGDHPSSAQPGDRNFLSPTHDAKTRADMITHTLGEPHVLRRSDFVTVNIRDHFLLLSSGGLHDFVRKERIAEIILRNGENVETSCENLLQEAQSAGSEKTITIVLIHGHLM
jgi:serine/threonine protein phosphatase PrpC